MKSYPDLPVPQTEGIDKEKQHKDDIAETKKRLELLRQRKLAEMQKNKKTTSRRKSSTSSSSSAATPKVEQSKAVTNTADEVKEDDIKRYDNKGDDDSDSDIEIKKKMAVKKRKKKRIRDTDDSESESDAKAAQVDDDHDDLIEKLVGFKPDEVNQHLPQIQALAKSLESMKDIPDDEPKEVKKEEFIQFSAKGYPGGAAKLAKFLKTHYGGNPKAVQVLPEWLGDKLCLWQLTKDQVKIVTDSRQIRKRKRIYTEKEYDDKCGVKHPKVALDDIEAQLAMMDQDDDEEEEGQPDNDKPEAVVNDNKPEESPTTAVQDNQVPMDCQPDDQINVPSAVKQQIENGVKNEEDSEEEFRGFNIDPKDYQEPNNTNADIGIEDMDLYEWLDDDSMPKESYLEVHFSPSLVTHLKKVLAKDKEAMKELNKIQRENKTKKTNVKNQPWKPKDPQDYPLPPSPESNPSDSSDKGNNFHLFVS